MTQAGERRDKTVRIRRYLALLAAVTLLALLLTACQLVALTPQGKVSSSRPESPPIALAAPASGPDVAVTAVDFEPPLRPTSNITAGDISLLVAVENRGDRRERDIELVAQILGNSNEVLYSDARIIDSLAAGEGRVVQFNHLSGLPLRPSYLIKVWANQVPGETKVENNVKLFPIQISLSST